MAGGVSELGCGRGKHIRVTSRWWVERVRRREAIAMNRTSPRVHGLNRRMKAISWTEQGTKEEQDTLEQQVHTRA